MATYIFDFDGTLADSFALIRDVVMQEAAALKCRQLVMAEIPLLQGMDAKQVFHYLHVPFWRRVFFIRKLRQLTHERVHEIRLFPEWPGILRQLAVQEDQLGIISSNSHQTVNRVLNQYDITNEFDFIYCGNSLFGKKRCLAQLIQKYRFSLRKTYYIGDEVRDIKAAQANRIHSIAVGWGFNSAEKLCEQKPSLFVLDFEALKMFFNERSTAEHLTDKY